MVSSARSLGEASSSAASRSSSSGSGPRGRVPLIGRVTRSVAARLVKRLGAGRDDRQVFPVQERRERRRARLL